MSVPQISTPWQFETITLGEYIEFPKIAAGIIRQQRCDYVTAVEQVLGGRIVSDTERRWLVDKTKQHVMLSFFDGNREGN